MKRARGAAAVLTLLAALAAAFVYSGDYNIAADDPHWPLTERLLATLRTRSIEARASNLDVPDLTDAALIRQGDGNYDSMCTGCHLAPGMESTELSRGLYPAPPAFATAKKGNPEAVVVLVLIPDGAAATLTKQLHWHEFIGLWGARGLKGLLENAGVRVRRRAGLERIERGAQPLLLRRLHALQLGEQRLELREQLLVPLRRVTDVELVVVAHAQCACIAADTDVDLAHSGFLIG